VSLRVRADYERIAIAAARMSVVLVNFGFWIGSLWGDNLRLVRAVSLNDDAVGMVRRGGAMIPSGVFSIGWALALIAVGVWGVRSNRRWVVNVAAVFAGIHFYTQWFSILGANAVSVLAGGILMIAAAFALRSLNKPAPLQPAV
jgi:iron complex transport system permease protein